MKTIFYIATFALLIFLVSCLPKASPCPICAEAPQVIAWHIVSKTNNTDLLYNKTYSPDSVQAYYINNNTKVGVDIKFSTDSAHHKVTIYSGDMVQKSISGIKTFFLKLNYQDTDTAFLNMVLQKGGCCSSYTIQQFTINNQTLATDSIDYAFVFKK